MSVTQSWTPFIVLVLIYRVKNCHTFEVDEMSVETEYDVPLDSEQLKPVDFWEPHAKPEKTNQLIKLTINKIDTIQTKTFHTRHARQQQIVIVVVACENKLDQTLNLIKSALIFTKRKLHFVILTDEYVKEISNILYLWSRDLLDGRLIFTVMKMAPLVINSAYSSEKFRKCGAQKLFLPSLLSNTNLVLYVETASVFLGPVQELWSVFDKFDSSHIAAMSRDPTLYGVSILMNLQRMRQFGWVNYITQITKEWNKHVNLTGQDIMDIIFNHHQRAVMHLPCKYSYQTNLCDAQYRCPGARTSRVLLLHSSNNDIDLTFEVVSNIVRDFIIGVHTKAILSYNLMLNAAYSTPCISMIGNFLRTRSHENPVSTKHSIDEINETTIVVSFVVCDTRIAESMNLVKSVLFFTSRPIHFVVFAEENLKNVLKRQMSKLKGKTLLSFEIHDITIPEDARKEWVELFSKCLSQKLFIPKLLPHIDSLIYLDTNSIFLGPVDEIWKHLSKFDRVQMAGMTVNRFDLDPKFSKNAQYWNFDVNSGVMLMNLTRLRQFDWTNYVTFVLPSGNLSSSWGDQVVLNIIFNEYPNGVYELPCRYNYRVEHCIDGDTCPSAADGVLILHGGRGVFHRDANHAFSAIYKAMKEYKLGTDKKLFLSKMKLYLERVAKWFCKNMSSQFLKIPTEFLSLEETELNPSTVKPLFTEKLLTVPPLSVNILNMKPVTVKTPPLEFINEEPRIVESELRNKIESSVQDDIIWH